MCVARTVLGKGGGRWKDDMYGAVTTMRFGCFLRRAYAGVSPGLCFRGNSESGTVLY